MSLYHTLLFTLLPFTAAAQTPVDQTQAELAGLRAYEAKQVSKDTLPVPPPAPNQAFFGAHLSRTMGLLTGSSRDLHLPVKVLIYGQSITGSKVFTDTLSHYLHHKFPDAAITLENRCIGGFGAAQIIRTAEHDLYPANPDMLIFHVYGGEKTGDLEELFSQVRRRTTADILLLSHHLNAGQKQVNPLSANYLRYIAAKYGCELVDVPAEWPAYLQKAHLQPADLLRDNVHPNRNGNWLLVQLLGRHLIYNPLFANSWYQNVKSYYLKNYLDNLDQRIQFKGDDWGLANGTVLTGKAGHSIKLSFTGTRVDAITTAVKGIKAYGSAHLKIDGKAVEEVPSLLQITRPSAGPNTWWPAVRRVSARKQLVPEEWTLTVDKVSADSTTYYFHVEGSVTGSDGAGNSSEAFTSRSGRVFIDSGDVIFDIIRKTFKTRIPNGFQVKWSVIRAYNGIYKPRPDSDASYIYKTTLVSGLAPGPHKLEIIVDGSSLMPLQALEVHSPPLNDDRMKSNHKLPLMLLVKYNWHH